MEPVEVTLAVDGGEVAPAAGASDAPRCNTTKCYCSSAVHCLFEIAAFNDSHQRQMSSALSRELNATACIVSEFEV